MTVAGSMLSILTVKIIRVNKQTAPSDDHPKKEEELKQYEILVNKLMEAERK